MIEVLASAYAPLLFWTGLGLLLARRIPTEVPHFLGRALYWVGIPLQLFVLARRTDISAAGFIPAVVIGVLLLGAGLAVVSWVGLQWFTQRTVKLAQQPSSYPAIEATLPTASPVDRTQLGSFMLAAMLGNTGFVGLPLIEMLIHDAHNSWAVLFSVTNGVLGAYGIAVLIASYFGHGNSRNQGWTLLRDTLTVPSLWAFMLGIYCHSIHLPAVIDTGLEWAVWLVIASALLLVGLRLGTMKGWHSLELAVIPAALRVIVIPAIVGLCATWAGITGDSRLILVLMSGAPTGLSVLILSEVYDLDHDLLASSITLTFVGLLLILPLWFLWFG